MIVDTHLKGSLFALLFDDGFHLFLSLFPPFPSNSGRVDSSVDDELLQSDPGDLSSHRIKAGDDDGFRRVIDDQVDSRQSFDGF